MIFVATEKGTKMLLVNKQEMIKQIGVRNMVSLFPEWYELTEKEKRLLIRLGKFHHQVLVKAKAIDAAPIVRCKDCLCWTETARRNGKAYGDCTQHGGEYWYEDDFCSLGGRRSDD